MKKRHYVLLPLALLLSYVALAPPLIGHYLRQWAAQHPGLSLEQSYGFSRLRGQLGEVLFESQWHYAPSQWLRGRLLRFELRQGAEIWARGHLNPLLRWQAEGEAQAWRAWQWSAWTAQGRLWPRRGQLNMGQWQGGDGWRIQRLQGEWHRDGGQLSFQPHWAQQPPEIDLRPLWRQSWQLQWQIQGEALSYRLQVPTQLELSQELPREALQFPLLLQGARLRIPVQAAQENGWTAALLGLYGSLLLPRHGEHYEFTLQSFPQWRLLAPKSLSSP